MDKAFTDLITTLCSDAVKGNDFIIPSLNTQGMEALVSAEEFPTLLEQYVVYADKVKMAMKISNWQHSYEFLKIVLTEILYDGKGYFVPCFGGYIQKDIDSMTKELKPILVARPRTVKGYDARGNVIDIDITNQKGIAPHTPALAYNMDTDTVFEKFLKMLYMNLHRFDQYILERKRNMKQQVSEKTEELNSGVGEKILREPFRETIEKEAEKKNEG